VLREKKGIEKMLIEINEKSAQKIVGGLLYRALDYCLQNENISEIEKGIFNILITEFSPSLSEEGILARRAKECALQHYDNKIRAIKAFQKMYPNFGLREAKEAIDAIWTN